MGGIQMGKGVGGGDVQAFPLTSAALCGVGSTSGVNGDGVFAWVKMATCVEDGSITISFTDGDKELNVSEGWVRSFPLGQTVTITTGKFDLVD